MILNRPYKNVVKNYRGFADKEKTVFESDEIGRVCFLLAKAKIV